MNNQNRLKEYVESALAAGCKPGQIRSALIERGWPEKKIKSFLPEQTTWPIILLVSIFITIILTFIFINPQITGAVPAGAPLQPPQYSPGAPTQTNPILISTDPATNDTDQNITCYNQSTTDATTNIYNWYKNDNPIMVLNMPFDTNSSTTVKDYSGYGNNGTINGSATWTSSGRAGGAYDFNGADDYISIPDNASIENAIMTISVWIKSNSFDDVHSIAFKRVNDTEYCQYGLSIYFGTLYWLQSQTGDWDTIVSAGAPSTGAWHHIVGVNTGSAARLYIDGVEVGEPDTFPATSLAESAEPLNIGFGRENFGDAYFNGTIDDVRIYNYALSPEQVYQLFVETKDGYSDNATIVSSETNSGDSWKCEVTPNNGTEDGDALNSSTLKISYTSVQDGDWSDSNTWGVASGYPTTGDTAIIPNGRTVTINSSTNAEIYKITINSGGTLNMSAGANLTFDTGYSGGGGIYSNGTLNCNGNSTANVTIKGGVYNDGWKNQFDTGATWIANYTVLDTMGGWGEGSWTGGFVGWDHVTKLTDVDFLIFGQLTANSYVRNFWSSGRIAPWFMTDPAITGTYDFDNWTINYDLIYPGGTNNLTIKNLGFIYGSCYWGVYPGGSNNNLHFINFTNPYYYLIVSGGDYDQNITWDNAMTTDPSSTTPFYLSGGKYHFYLNKSNLIFATVNPFNTTAEGSFIVSANHDDIAGNYLGIFNNANASEISSWDSSYIFGANDNVNVTTGTLNIDENANVNDLTIYNATTSIIDIVNNATLIMSGNLTLSGSFKVTNGSAINISGLGANYTTFSVGNANNIQLNNWTSIPAGLKGTAGKAVNISNTSESAYTDLNISYACNGEKIWRYDGSSWTALENTGCDSADQVVWAKNINTFSLFASGSCPDNYTYTSVQSGDWTDNNTWGVIASCGYPETGDTAVISNTHTVEINSSTNAEVFNITIQAGGALNISAGANLTFDDTNKTGFGYMQGIQGTLNCNGNSTDHVKIAINQSATYDWWALLNDTGTWHASYADFNNTEMDYALDTGKFDWDNVDINQDHQAIYFNAPNANSRWTNITYRQRPAFFNVNASLGGTLTIDSLEATPAADLIFIYNVVNTTFFNMNFTYWGFNTLADGINDWTCVNCSTTFMLLLMDTDSPAHSNFTCINCSQSGTDSGPIGFRHDGFGRAYLINSTTNVKEDTQDNYTVNSSAEGSFVFWQNLNNTAGDYRGIFYKANVSSINNEYMFGKDDNFILVTPDAAYNNTLYIDENTNVRNLSVSNNTIIDIVSNNNLTMYGNLTLNGIFKITNGSAINVTGDGMNYTTFSVANASNISLNNWNSIPSGLRQATGKAVNLTNTFASAYTDLNISYACTNERIWRYNETSTFWEAIDDSGCDAVNQVVWAKDITQFSLFSPAECPSKYQSVQSGDWADNNTWGTPSPDCYPQASETATINNGHTVEINSSTNAQVFKIWILEGGNLNVSAGANITFDDNGGTDYPGFNTYYYGMTYGNLNVNGNATNHIHITIANTSSPYTWLYGYFGANADSIIRLHYVDADYHYNSRPEHWDFDHVIFNNSDHADAFLPWGFATGNNSITNTYFDGRINLYSYPNATLSASDVFDNITVMADMVLYGYYAPVTNLTFTNMYIYSGLTSVYLVDNITMINYTSPTWIGWFCPTELGNYSHYYFDNASAVYEYPIVFCGSPVDGGIRMYFNNSDFTFNQPYNNFAITNLGTNSSFAISTNHNNTIGDWRGMFLYANSSDIEDKYMFGSSDNININEGTLNINENADVNNIFLDAGQVWNNATLNIDNGAILTSTGNLTISENAAFEITNGTATNITLNGTKSTLEATDVQMFNVQSYPADESGLHNISKYVNVSNTSSSASLDLNISYSIGDLNGKNESELKIYSYNGSDWIAESDTGVDTTNKVVWAKNITSFSIKAPMGNAKPDAPILQTPVNESIVIDLTPALNWSVPADADGDTLHFEFQLANDSAFAEIVESANSSDDTTGFDPAPPVAEGAGTEIYTIQNKLEFRQFWWRVRAFDGAEYSDWSEPFTFNTTTSVVCSLSQSEIDFGSFSPGVNVNATLNFAGPDDGTLYNVTSTSNVNVNMTNKGTNLTSGANYIPAGNVGWQSNATDATGSNMIYSSHIDLTEDYDYANMVASNVSENSAVWLRYWLSTVSEQVPGLYTGNYTLKCEQA